MKPAVVALLACLLCIGCTKISSPAKESDKQDLPQQELYTATITFYQDDKLSGVLQAGRIRKYEKQSVILLDSSLVMDFYGTDGKHTSKVWADSGRTDEVRKDMVAMGRVIALSDSGMMLETSELRWDNRSRKIRSDTRCKFSTPTDTIYGTGFISDEHLKNWSIEQPQGRTFRDLEKRARDTTLAAPLPDSGVSP
ncbi:LPS export ABC transporter periplasmic protein LptC [candidate division KSB1 bacterium]|nr:MAG: LPS export ABC transporter periplasmic protein LptC [candidate division KSB1 bacterium]